MEETQSSDNTTQESGQSTTIKSSTTTPLNSAVQPQESLEPIIETVNPSKEYTSEEVKSNPPLSQYEDIRGTKYSVEYFDIPDIFQGDGPESPQVTELKESVTLIEEYVLEQIEGRSMKDNKDSYDSIISEILNEIETIDNEIPTSRINRIGYYIDYLKKVNAK